MRVPTLDAVCKNNNEKPAKGAKAPPSAASAYSLASHDLVKGKYEGGLKLWECAIDLTKYVVRERVVEAMVTLSKSKSFRVLELGCGHGVPGIASLMAREKMEKDGKDTTLLCTLADYNEEVLTEVTIPNARLNGVCEQCTFLAGDWDDLVAAPSKKQSEAFLSKDEFDLILTSDTIYNVDDAKKLAKVIHHCLKKNANENAIALVAAKRYYFGVGGSTATFMQLCDETSLSCDVVKEIMDGASNVREIIRVRIKT
jgi:SAM-dependent methyltransferase